MHETGIALELMEIAKKEMLKAGVEHITAIGLQIGRWSGVEPETLKFAFEAVTMDTPLSGCTLDILMVEPTFECKECGEDFIAEGYFDPCTRCGGAGGALKGGDEFKITHLEADD